MIGRPPAFRLGRLPSPASSRKILARACAALGRVLTFMSPFFARLRNRLRRLRNLADAHENPVQVLHYAPQRRPGVELRLDYDPPAPRQPLPVPPAELWLGYGNDAESYVASGREDVERMATILADASFDLQNPSGPILDLGCGGGRMIRQLLPAATRTEVWGLDVSARHIAWLKTHLSPPFRFAVNTVLPHLPFPDGTFHCIYCGSVFTHIDDLAEAWWLELRRVLAPRGLLFCTLHDDHARRILQNDSRYPLAAALRGHPLLDPNSPVGDIVAIGSGHDSNVFYSDRYLRAFLEPLFEIVSTTPAAYGYQTAWTLRRPPTVPTAATS